MDYGKACNVGDNTVGGELFHIIDAKLKPNLWNMSMCDKKCLTCKLGNDPIGMIMCCNTKGKDNTFNFLII